MSKTSLALPLLISIAALACEESPPPLAEPDAPRVSRLEQLAFEDPAGGSAADRRIRELQSILKAHPDKLDGWILLGRAFIEKARQATEPGYYANARACAARALELRPEYPLALDLEAMVLMNQHRFEEAKALATRVLAQDPDDLYALGTFSDAALELGEVEAAAEKVERMAALKPSLPAYARVAHLRWLHGDAAGAKAAYRLAMDAGRGARDMEPFAWVTTEAARIFLAEGDGEGAEAGFMRALEAQPGYPPAVVGLGRVALARADFAAAARHFAAAYAESALAETAWLLAEAEARAGRPEAAAAARQKVLRLGRHGEGRVLAAMLATEDRDLDEAFAAISRELQGRGDHHTHATHALVLLRRGAISKARAALDRARRLGTADPTLSAYEALVLAEEGRAGAAKTMAARALVGRGMLPPSLVEELRAWSEPRVAP